MRHEYVAPHTIGIELGVAGNVIGPQHTVHYRAKTLCRAVGDVACRLREVGDRHGLVHVGIGVTLVIQVNIRGHVAGQADVIHIGGLILVVVAQIGRQVWISILQRKVFAIGQDLRGRCAIVVADVLVEPVAIAEKGKRPARRQFGLNFQQFVVVFCVLKSQVPVGAYILKIREHARISQVFNFTALNVEIFIPSSPTAVADRFAGVHVVGKGLGVHIDRAAECGGAEIARVAGTAINVNAANG